MDHNTEGLSFSSLDSLSPADDDASETIISYTMDWSSLIVDANIATRLVELTGAATFANLRSLLKGGAFTFDDTLQTITVNAGDAGGLYLDPRLFLDSDIDFDIPVSVAIEDSAVIDGMYQNKWH